MIYASRVSIGGRLQVLAQLGAQLIGEPSVHLISLEQAVLKPSQLRLLQSYEVGQQPLPAARSTLSISKDRIGIQLGSARRIVCMGTSLLCFLLTLRLSSSNRPHLPNGSELPSLFEEPVVVFLFLCQFWTFMDGCFGRNGLVLETYKKVSDIISE